jgi:hypothetical protein
MVAMTDNVTGRDWADVQFHAKGRLEVPETHRDTGRRIHRLQADDDIRFRDATTSLLERLDLSSGVITAMTCDHRFALLFENWVASCDRFGIECRASTIVFPTDRVALERVEALGFVAYFDDESQQVREMTDSHAYGSSAWTEYMYHQNWVIKNLLELPADLLFQDVDLVWRHDPIPLLRREAAAGADIQAMYDGPNPRFQPLYANGGFMYFRHSPRVQNFWAEVYARHDMVSYYGSQQEPLNVLLAAHAARDLDVRLLDEQRFANGHLYCGPPTPPPDPWVMHNSWTGTLSEKLERYVANDLWFLDQSAIAEPTSDADVERVTPAEPRRHEPESPRPAKGPEVVSDESNPELLGLLRQVANERDALRRELQAMSASTSWRITEPLRRARAAWSRLRR